MKHSKATTATRSPEKRHEDARRAATRAAVQAQRAAIEALRHELEMYVLECTHALEQLAALDPWLDGGELPSSVARYREVYRLTYGLVAEDPAYTVFSPEEQRALYWRVYGWSPDERPTSVPSIAARRAARNEMLNFESPLELCSVGPCSFALAAGLLDLDAARAFLEVAASETAQELSSAALARATRQQKTGLRSAGGTQTRKGR
jgi:hypothetical protein